MTSMRQLLPIICFTVLAPALFAGNYSADKEHSELSATMHAVPSHQFTSVATDYAYDITIDPQTLAIQSASCSFEFSDLDSGEKSRDKKMCDWMDIEKYPSASFKMTDVQPPNADGQQVATGDFTMHGVTIPVTIPVTVTKHGDTIIIEGETELDHRNWGLKKVRLWFFSVDPVLKPHFHLEGSLKNTDA